MATCTPPATVKLRRAGEESSLPARSRAFTSNAWDPAASPESAALVTAANGVKAPPSSRQANASPAGGLRLSVPVNVNVAEGSPTVSTGPPVICVSGGVLSTMTVRLAVPAFWAWSVADAVNV
jgi:hypothetical protein